MIISSIIYILRAISFWNSEHGVEAQYKAWVEMITRIGKPQRYPGNKNKALDGLNLRDLLADVPLAVYVDKPEYLVCFNSLMIMLPE